MKSSHYPGKYLPFRETERYDSARPVNLADASRDSARFSATGAPSAKSKREKKASPFKHPKCFSLPVISRDSNNISRLYKSGSGGKKTASLFSSALPSVISGLAGSNLSRGINSRPRRIRLVHSECLRVSWSSKVSSKFKGSFMTL